MIKSHEFSAAFLCVPPAFYALSLCEVQFRFRNSSLFHSFYLKIQKNYSFKRTSCNKCDSFSKLLRLKMQSQPFGIEERPQYGILLTEQIDVEKLDNFVGSFRI